MLGPVVLSGLNEGKRDLSRQKWTYQVKMINFLSLAHCKYFIITHINYLVKFISFIFFRLALKEKT